jgi:hypothetical protein
LVNFLSDNDYGKNYNDKTTGAFVDSFLKLGKEETITIDELENKLFEF